MILRKMIGKIETRKLHRAVKMSMKLVDMLLPMMKAQEILMNQLDKMHPLYSFRLIQERRASQK